AFLFCKGDFAFNVESSLAASVIKGLSTPLEGLEVLGFDDCRVDCDIYIRFGVSKITLSARGRFEEPLSGIFRGGGRSVRKEYGFNWRVFKTEPLKSSAWRAVENLDFRRGSQRKLIFSRLRCGKILHHIKAHAVRQDFRRYLTELCFKFIDGLGRRHLRWLVFRDRARRTELLLDTLAESL